MYCLQQAFEQDLYCHQSDAWSVRLDNPENACAAELELRYITAGTILIGLKNLTYGVKPGRF
ncbi:hypothetical protein GCM10009092_07370 [Bowmanella denitrificans]|uniref:Uncharacterized protein n=1 Tax=Bowmanella denitrificans TaxID=366582 RepID=A0ABP3GKA0_9ALTE